MIYNQIMVTNTLNLITKIQKGIKNLTAELNELKAYNEFVEDEHPRDSEGKFTDTGAIPDHIRRKIESVKIDFARDNILPELNTEDLEDLGVKSKPVMVSKRMLTRNLQAHPEIDKKDYDKLLSYGLYNADYIFRANREKPSYFHMIAKLPDGKSNSGLIIELSDNKDNFEIVHVTKLRDRSVRSLTKKNR